MKHIYCPVCGKKLIQKQAGDDGLVPYCDGCEKYWFDTFSDVVMVLTYNEYDEIVLTRAGYMSEVYRSATTGFITPGENAEEAAYREVKEELGLDLESLEYVGSLWFEKGDMLMHSYIGFAHKKELVMSSELDSAEWVPYEKAPETMFPYGPGNALWHSYRAFLEKRGSR